VPINSVEDVVEVLKNAERLGSLIDKPEGQRYIQLSDTLAQEMVKALEGVKRK